MVNRAAIAGNVTVFFLISHLQTSLEYNLGVGWFLFASRKLANL